MSHFTVWVLMTVGGVIGALLQLNRWETASDCAYFTGLALLVHWLYATR